MLGVALALTMSGGAIPAAALPVQGGLAPGARARIDSGIRDILAAEGAPSASVALVLQGRRIYAKAVGGASLSPRRAASTKTRYQLASASKSITAQTLLLLAADGRLSLDAPVARWLPQVTGSEQLTVRQLLEHVSGLPNHYPQTYPAGPRTQATNPDRIIAEWGRRPLMFPPGSQFRYSNLNYVVAGRIAELAAGEPLFALQQRRIFKPLGMDDVIDLDRVTQTTPEVATGYVRVGLAPLETAPVEGPGWSFGAGQVVATASDLARWDMGLLSSALLPHKSTQEETTAPTLPNHDPSPYALGVFVSNKSGRLVWSHVGQELGFLAANTIYPNDRLAVVVLTNTSATQTFAHITDRISYLLLAPTPADARARSLFQALQSGRIDGQTLTPGFLAYLRSKWLNLYRTSLGPLGGLTSLVLRSEQSADGVTTRRYEATAGRRRLSITWEELSDGQTDDFLIQPSLN